MMRALSEAKGRIMFAMANAGSRNRSPWGRFCRAAFGIVLAPPRRDDFMADAMVDGDEGFSAEELRAWQAGAGGGAFRVVDEG